MFGDPNPFLAMKILFFSDIHLPLGPREPIRPEMRKLLSRFLPFSNHFMNRFEDRLRLEAKRVTRFATLWKHERSDSYDLLINGGDLAMPLSKHSDRLSAAEQVWREEVSRYTEDRYLALTGNHELGHGYEVYPECYADFVKLRKRLFNNKINRDGYGVIEHEECNILFVDSELIALGLKNNGDTNIDICYQDMINLVWETILSPLPIIIFTHNTARVRKWLRSEMNFWPDLVAHGRKIQLIGGHFHIPRSRHRDGIEVHWTGGGSYPEPMLRYFVNMPFSGILRGGAGAIEVVVIKNRIVVKQLSYNVPMGDLRRTFG